MINQDNKFLKVSLYMLSLELLFIFIIIITIRLPYPYFAPLSIEVSLNSYREDVVVVTPTLLSAFFSALKSAIWKNIVAFFSALALIVCLIFKKFFDFKINGAPDIPIKITKLKKLDYEHLTFLMTYLVPLLCFDFSNERQILVFVLLLIVIGIIYIETNLFYANPSLALLGFHIYRVNATFKTREIDEIIIISQDILEEDDFVLHIKLDDRIFYARRKK
jgi:hypothetical protein